MKKIVLIILLLFTINVYAGNCDSNEFKRLKALAEKIEFTYDYDIKKDENTGYEYADFSVTAVNLNKDLKVMIIYDYYKDQYSEFLYNKDLKSTLNGFVSGENVKITFKAYTSNDCSNKTILTKNIKLPYYNYFYEEDFCKDNKSFKYCNILIDKDINYNDYINAKNTYLSSEEENNVERITEKNNSNYIYIIVGIISLIVFIITIYFLFKRKEKNSL